jgi:hypothetical protein
MDYGNIMAAPVGHIICAISLLNSGVSNISDKNAFLAGTSFPDIRYISSVKRATTHKVESRSLKYVLEASTSFEAGRRFHVFIDREREKHMLKHGAYQFIKNGPLRTQMLKLIEDHILFSKLDKIESHHVFGKIYQEERDFSVDDSTINVWHKILATYLDQSHWFNAVRYYKTLREFQNVHGFPKDFFSQIWMGIRTMSFFVYAYFQMEKLSRDKNLRAIIMDFYDNKMREIIKTHQKDANHRPVDLHALAPP